MKASEVRRYARARLQWLWDLPEHPQKAALANLRRGVGRIPGNIPELWGAFLEDLPPEAQRQDGVPTREEWALYLALTLYAMHQQGHGLPQNNMHQDDARFGSAVRQLVKPDEKPGESSILRRFNALATAADMQECAQHLRGMIQLLRGKGFRWITRSWPWISMRCSFPRQRPRCACGGDRSFTERPQRRSRKMKNRLYIDFHVLQTVPPSCVNRDDTGSPKTARYGAPPGPGFPPRPGSGPCA